MPTGETNWRAPASDYARGDRESTWMPPVGEPAGLPAPVEPVTERVGWLTRGRDGGPDAA